MTIICHLKSMFTFPGTVSKEYINNNQNNSNICKKCNIPRPERAHHCKICKFCILKFDHHCPWIANCVGINNQKNFVQFLFFATFGDLIAFLSFLPKLISLNLNIKIKGKLTTIEILYQMSDKLLLLVASLLSISMVISIGFLLYVQLKFILNNITSIEIKNIEPEEGKYFDENKFNSFKIVMGESFLDWFNIIPELNNVNNGYIYGKYCDIHNEKILKSKTFLFRCKLLLLFK